LFPLVVNMFFGIELINSFIFNKLEYLYYIA
jgi:hypothetical protein